MTWPMTNTVREFLQRWNPSSCFDSSVAEEYDDYERPADLWLYCSPVGSSGSSHRGSDCSSGQNSQGTVNKEYSHWILVFKFQDETISAIDGNNEDDKLTPSYWKRIDESWTECKKIGTVNISPRQVRDIAVRHPMNGNNYFFWGSNCHVWANYVLKALGLDELSETIDREIALIASAAVIAGGCSIGYMLSK